jgi:hypothetical protein
LIPSAEKAEFCITGDNECWTGSPIIQYVLIGDDII